MIEECVEESQDLKNWYTKECSKILQRDDVILNIHKQLENVDTKVQEHCALKERQKKLIVVINKLNIVCKRKLIVMF